MAKRRSIRQGVKRSGLAEDRSSVDSGPAPSSVGNFAEVVRDLEGPATARRRLLPWVFGLLVFSTLILVALHFSSLERLIQLAEKAHPTWLLFGCLTQAATYVCAATVWRQVLRRAGHPRSLKTLAPLGIAKLFTDQTIPSGGMSGTILVMSGLARRRVPPNIAMAAMLVDLISYDTAYLTIALTSLGVLWLHHRVSLAIFAAVAAVAVITVGIPVTVLSLRWWSARAPGSWLRRLPGTTTLLRILADAPTDLLRHPRLLTETVTLQMGIFLLDALTLWLAFYAIGETLDFWIVFVSFVAASMAATIGPIPLGLGTFEAGSIGMLSFLDVPIEAALAGTLLLRGLTFWLPMIPGLWLARREIHRL